MPLSRYLQHPEHVQAFKGFLAKEFAVENLIFWKDFTRLRAFAVTRTQHLPVDSQLPGHVHSIQIAEVGSLLPSANADLYQMLQMIRKTYIENNAPEAINISFRMRDNICTELQTLTPQSPITVAEIDRIFKPAIREVVEMMESDHFLRFIKSDHYVLNKDTPRSLEGSPDKSNNNPCLGESKATDKGTIEFGPLLSESADSGYSPKGLEREGFPDYVTEVMALSTPRQEERD